MLLQFNPHDHATEATTDLFGAPAGTPPHRATRTQPQDEGEFRRTTSRRRCEHCQDEAADAARAGQSKRPYVAWANYQSMRGGTLIYLCAMHAWRAGYHGTA